MARKAKTMTEEERRESKTFTKMLKASAPDKPTELGPIADAIRELGEELRGKKA